MRSYGYFETAPTSYIPTIIDRGGRPGRGRGRPAATAAGRSDARRPVSGFPKGACEAWRGPVAGTRQTLAKINEISPDQ